MGEPLLSSIRVPLKICCMASVTRKGGSLNLLAIKAFQEPQTAPTTMQTSRMTGNGIPSTWESSPEMMPIMHII